MPATATTASATVNDTDYTILIADQQTYARARLSIVVDTDVDAADSFADLQESNRNFFEVISCGECVVRDASFPTDLDFACVADIRMIHDIIYAAEKLGISYKIVYAYARYKGVDGFDADTCVGLFEGAYKSPSDWLSQRLDLVDVTALDKLVSIVVGGDVSFDDLVDAERLFTAYMNGDRVHFGGFADGFHVWAIR